MRITTTIVTNCTQRKAPTESKIDLVRLPSQLGVEELASAWLDVVSEASRELPADQMYRGRSIADATASAAFVESSWFVISAGLGLVRSSEKIPAYECTVASGSELCYRLKTAGATTADWWSAITSHQPRPLSRLISHAPTLLALPSSYLQMVHDDLAEVSTSESKHLRIFTSAAGARVVPSHLVNCVMPYDDRLEAMEGHAGTRSDFAQRALRHFVETLEATTLPIEEARSRVLTALEGRTSPVRLTGRRMSDEEIQRVLTEQWNRHAGSSTRLLRYLRDEAGISCEQKRFRKLWQSLAPTLRA